LNTQSLLNFALDAAIELLAHADELEKSGILSNNSLDAVPVEEALRRARQAKQRKRNLFELFNTEDGLNLRLRVSAHEKTQLRETKYCALCVNNSRPEGNEFRGHRSSFKCSKCDVHMCVRVYAGLFKSYWSLWHTTRDLEARDTPRPRA
jgi:hypothetical protein